MHATATPEHQWLQQLVGTWTCESRCIMGPDGETTTGHGREVVRPIGELWVVGEMTGEMPGAGSMTGIITLGFDPRRRRYVGTWVGSPMDHLWQYDGTRDETGTTLTLDCTGPSFTDPEASAAYQDVIELPGDGSRVLRSRVQQDDGGWFEFMRTDFRREA